MIPLEVRGALPRERAAIRALTVAAYAEYLAVLGATNWDRYRANIEATLADGAPGVQIAALTDGRLVGAVLLYPGGSSLAIPGADASTPDVPEVRLLAVAPESRGRGVGEALMNECVERARRSGAGSVTLHTTDMMRAAMRLYERLGFEREPALDFDPAPGVTAKGYRLRL